MTRVFLNHDQTEVIRKAPNGVEICDPNGALIGYVTRKSTATPEEIAEALKRAASPGPWHTTEQFLARLRALETQ